MEIANGNFRITSGYNLREIIDHINELRFRSQAEKHELSHTRRKTAKTATHFRRA